MSTPKIKTEIRKEQIAEAALAVIATYGINELSIARVARRIGLVPSAVYRHFKGKGEILDAVLLLIEGRLAENVAIAQSQESDSLDQLGLLLRLHVQFIRENRGIFRIIFSEEMYRDDPGRKTRIFNMIRRYLSRVQEIIRSGQAAARIRADISPKTMSIMFLGLIQPAAILWNLSDGEFDVTKHAEKGWQLFRETIEIGNSPHVGYGKRR